MGFNLPVVFIFLALCLFQYCNCAHVKSLNASLAGFQPAVATFYGPPSGAGSDGGACGYANAVSESPFNSFVSAGNGPLFRKGFGCGLWTMNDLDVHFDLSGTAMGALAKPTRYVIWELVPCQYKNTNIQFKVDHCSNPNFLSVNFLPSRSTKAITANHVFGATWSSNANPSAQPAPYSIRLTTEFNKKLITTNVIPVGCKPR
ncbi:unnamed protein product [Withania somnifera]